MLKLAIIIIIIMATVVAATSTVTKTTFYPMINRVLQTGNTVVIEGWCAGFPKGKVIVGQNTNDFLTLRAIYDPVTETVKSSYYVYEGITYEQLASIPCTLESHVENIASNIWHAISKLINDKKIQVANN
jgi:hypothetical protein